MFSVESVYRVTTELAAGAGVEQCYNVIHTQEQCPNTQHCGHSHVVTGTSCCHGDPMVIQITDSMDTVQF